MAQGQVGQECQSASRVSFRALLTGALLAAVVNVGALYSTFINASWMALNISVPIAVFVFFVLVGVVNVFLKFLHRPLALDQGELTVVFIMLMVAATVPTEGYVEHMVPKIVSPSYYSTPENSWAENIQPFIKPWLAPQDPDVARYFFEGLPAGAPIPWGEWVRPLSAWSLFFLALCFVMVCIAVILRKQWIENERLVYPLVQLPLDMIRGGDGQERVTPFFKSVMMWTGFLIPFSILSINSLHNYFNFVPEISLSTSVPLIPGALHLGMALSFMTLGFSYFVNLQVLMGIWSCFALLLMQRAVYNVLGISMQQALPDSSASDAITAHQGMGAMIVFALVILWTAREHLGAVFRKAFSGDEQVDDSGEILSYRTAVLGLVLGLIFLGGWLELSGLPRWVVPWFLFVVFVLYIGLSRFVAEAGLATIRTPTDPQAFINSTVGTSALGQDGLVALSLTYAWVFKARIFVLAACANALKLEGESSVGPHKRRLFWAIAVALVTSLAAANWYLLEQAYAHGGINLNQMFFLRTNQGPFSAAAIWINSPTGVSGEGWFYTGLGGTAMLLLLLARHFWLWWPLHPIGFPIATTWVAGQIWCSVFLVWVFKSLVLKLGGPSAYRRIQPFFLGLILGNIVAGGMWFIIDGYTGMQGNVLVYF